MKQAHFLSDFICCDGKCTSAHIGSFFFISPEVIAVVESSLSVETPFDFSLYQAA